MNIGRHLSQMHNLKKGVFQESTIFCSLSYTVTGVSHNGANHMVRTKKGNSQIRIDLVWCGQLEWSWSYGENIVSSQARPGMWNNFKLGKSWVYKRRGSVERASTCLLVVEKVEDKNQN